MLHAGALVITGRAPDQLSFAYPGRAVGGDVAAADIVARHSPSFDPSHDLSTVCEIGSPGRGASAEAVTKTPDSPIRGAAITDRGAPTAPPFEGTPAEHQVRAEVSTRRRERAADAMPRGGHPDDGAPSRLVIPTDALAAIVGLGFKSAEARSALEAARAHVGHEPSLEIWIREGLRACARAKTTAGGAVAAAGGDRRRAPA